MTNTPKPQADTVDEIRDSHTMKLVPLSQRELFWFELEPKIQALITEARENELKRIGWIHHTSNGKAYILLSLEEYQDRLKQLKENK